MLSATFANQAYIINHFTRPVLYFQAHITDSIMLATNFRQYCCLHLSKTGCQVPSTTTTTRSALSTSLYEQNGSVNYLSNPVMCCPLFSPPGSVVAASATQLPRRVRCCRLQTLTPPPRPTIPESFHLGWKSFEKEACQRSFEAYKTEPSSHATPRGSWLFSRNERRAHFSLSFFFAQAFTT